MRLTCLRAIIARLGLLLSVLLLALAPSFTGSSALARPSTATIPDHALVGITSGNQTYLVYAGTRHFISSIRVLQILGLNRLKPQLLTLAELAQLPEGMPLVQRRNRPLAILSPIASGSQILAPASAVVPAGQAVSVTGHGFTPNETVQLSIDPGSAPSTVSAAADGSFQAAIVIPANTAPGTIVRIFAYGEVSKALEVEPITILAAQAQVAPHLMLNPTSVHPGGTVAVSGSGFQAAETVIVSIGANGTQVKALANGSGAFILAALPVPPSLTQGNATVIATGVTSHRRAEATLAIVAVTVPPIATPSRTGTATLTHTPVPSATSTHTPVPAATSTHTPVPAATSTHTPVPTATSTHTPVPSATSTQTPVPSATSTNTLVPSATSTHTPVPAATATHTPVPAATSTHTPTHTPIPTHTPSPTHTPIPTHTPSPTHTPIPTHTPSPTRTRTPVLVPPSVPALHVSSAMAKPGDQVQLSGAGFAPGELVLIRLNNVAVLTLRTNTAGGFANVPYVVAANTREGSYTLLATGINSGHSAGSTLRVAAGIGSANSPLPDGTLIRDTANGRDYLIWHGTRHWITSIETFNALGYNRSKVVTAADPFVQSIPEGAGISQRLVHGNLTLPTSPISTGNTTVRLAQPGAAPGATFTISGVGFGAGETVIVTFAGNAYNAVADAAGSFSLNLLMPPGAPIGSVQTLYAYGARTHVLALAPLFVLGFVTAPSVNVQPASVAQGGSLQVTGAGFQPGEQVNIFLAQGVFATTTVANGQGVIAAPLAVPAFLTPGAHSVIAFGTVSKLLASTTVTVTQPAPQPAKLTLSVANANPGSLVLVSGTGFTPGELVTISFGGKSVVVVRAASNGAFTNVGFTVPSFVTSGTVAVVATGGSSGRAVVVGLNVVIFNPSISVAPASSAPGAQVVVSGQGFAPNEAVSVALNGQAVVTSPATIVTSGSGTFVAAVTVPNTALSGANTLVASGTVSRSTATARLAVNLPVKSTWYFAGGSTDPGYSTQLALVNPNDQPALVTFSFMFTNGSPIPYSTTVGANSRATVDVGSIVGPNRQVFTTLTADRKIGAEETVFRNGLDFSSTIGASAPLRTWYLAEGFTGLTFHEYIRIFNPGTAAANVDLRLLPFNGRPAIAVPETVGAQSGLIVDVNALAPHLSLSAIVDSDQPIVVERLITFGVGGYGATEQIGSNAPSSTWLFAEGSTVNNFETYLSILNPSTTQPAAVTATFFDALGNVLGNTTILIDPLRRGNIKVNDIVRSSGIATILTSNIPVLAERPLYFGSPNSATAGAGGSDVFGRNGGGVSWLFPEGNTQGSYREFLLLQNPSAQIAQVRIRFYSTNGVAAERTLSLPPRSRATVDVLRNVTDLPPGLHAELVTATNGVPIIAEQSIYSDSFTKGDGVAGIAQ